MSGTFPNLNDVVSPVRVSWGLSANTFVFTSFSNVTQAVSQIGARWAGSMEFELTRAEKMELEIFVEDLDGRSGRFCVIDPSIETYPAQGTPTVNDANQVGKLLITSGWLPNRLILRKGQYFNIGNELKKCRQDIYSDSLGAANLRFNPAIRISPAQGTAINTQSPFMLASLNADENPFTTDANFQSSISLLFTEAIYERG